MAMLTFLRNRNPFRQQLSFLGLWLRRPASVGAVVPSSRALARAMAAQLDPKRPGTVVELGAGTGNITEALLEALGGAAQLVVVEKEPSLCRVLRGRFPDLRILEGDARRLSTLLDDAGISAVKAVVSSLPLVSLPVETCRAVLAECFALMGEGGIVVQFTYAPGSPLSRRMRRQLGIEGERRAWVLDNLPPAAVWVYRRSRLGASGARAA